MSLNCVHLHCHSSRSFKDGLTPVDELVEKAAKLEQPGLAITEHGNLFSAAQLATHAHDQGIKPVFGMEAYEAVPFDWDPERDAPILARPWDSGLARYYHLTLWVQNEQGWRNLCALHTLSYTERFKPKNQPLIDRASLNRFSDGLMIGLGCIQSRTNFLLRTEGVKAATESAAWYVDVFGKDRVFMEVMANLSDQQALLRGQRQIARELGIETIATNDVHYKDRIDGREHGAHHILVQARRFKKKDTEESKDKSDDGFGQWYGADEFFLKSADEFLATGGLQADEIERTLKVLDLVTFDFNKLPVPSPPLAPIPAPGADPTFDKWLALTGGT